MVSPLSASSILFDKLMKVTNWILFLVSLGVLGGAWLQSQIASSLVDLNAKLHREQALPTPETSQLLANQHEKARLQAETQDLLKLRNEVRQLRNQAKDLPGLRNAAQGATPAQTLVPTPEGFTSLETLANMGTATPEAAVQTFFWAMREQNVQSYLQTVSPHFLEQHGGNVPPEKMEQFNQHLQSRMQEQMKGFSNFRIIGQEQQRDMVIVTLQSSLSSKTAPIGVKLYGNEWRVEGPF